LTAFTQRLGGPFMGTTTHPHTHTRTHTHTQVFLKVTEEATDYDVRGGRAPSGDEAEMTEPPVRIVGAALESPGAQGKRGRRAIEAGGGAAVAHCCPLLLV